MALFGPSYASQTVQPTITDRLIRWRRESAGIYTVNLHQSLVLSTDQNASALTGYRNVTKMTAAAQFQQAAVECV